MDNERKDDSIQNDDEEELLSEKDDTESKNNSISADLIRGHINTIILRTLYERDKYGYEIMNEIEQKSHGQYSLKQPTLYSALKRLEGQGYIKAYWKTDSVTLGGRRKYFTLTELGKEFAEKNQSEWEYSRTVIDSLISDRSFDFNQPAPTPVDFKLLRKSVTRIRTGNGKDDEESEETEENEQHTAEGENREVAEEKTVTETDKSPSSDQDVTPEQKESKQLDPNQEAYLAPIQAEYTQQSSHPVFVQPEFIPSEPAPLQQPEYKQPEYVPEHEQVQPYSQPAYEQQPNVQQEPPVQRIYEQQPQQQYEPYAQPELAQQPMRDPIVTAEERARSEEERRIAHENYLKLISADTEEKQPEVEQIAPFADDIDTEKLIYNNKPEPERDYKKLVSNIYSKAIKREPPVQQFTQPQPQPAPQPAPPIPEPAPMYIPTQEVRVDSVVEKGQIDGLKVNTTSYNAARVTNAKNTTYNIGSTLFKSSAVVSVLMLLEFIFCLVFREAMGVGIIYPFVILALALAQLAIFAVLMFSGYGNNSARPTNHNYISASIILTIIIILIICLVAFLLNVNVNSVGDIMAKMVVPSIIALNIPVFTVTFRLFSKLGR